MTPERFQEVEHLFLAALEHPRSEQEAFVRDACDTDEGLRANVMAMLAQDDAAEQLLQGAVQRAAQSLWSSGPAVEPGRQIGPYLTVLEIGRGGMGVVYHAIRSDGEFHQAVALKVVRRGADSAHILRRFRAERQILARLEHPNIARLLDGGRTAEGEPYFVMELVEGAAPIIEYCVRQKLDLEARLRLFLAVCEAVGCAHRNLIVHRDLKPSNILVAAGGVVKLLDFGIAKVLETEGQPRPEADTTTESRMLTPQYASPEQVRGEPVTTATDVYSLGAVLYEMLCGAKAQKFDTYTPLEVARVICEREPERPSAVLRSQGQVRLARQVETDLDNIVLLAMRKDPGRRYSSVDALAEDLRRHLAHRPVIARQESITYKMGRFVRRNRLAVAASTLAAASLLVGTGVSLMQARRAERRFEEVRRLANTFLFDLHSEIATLPGATKARHMVVKTAVDYLDRLAKEARGEAALERELAVAYHRLGDAQGNVIRASLGDTDAAIQSYRKAEALLDDVLQRNPRDLEAQAALVPLCAALGDAFWYQRRTGEARKTLEKGMLVAERLQRERPSNQEWTAQRARLLVAAARGPLEAAESARAAAQAVEMLEPVASGADVDIRILLGDAYSMVGRNAARSGDLRDSLGIYLKNLKLRMEIASEKPQDTEVQRVLMLAYGHLGDTLGYEWTANLGDVPAAMKHYNSMLQIAVRLYQSDSSNRRAAMDYGFALMRVGTTMPAEEGHQKAIASLEKARGILGHLAEKDPGNRVLWGSVAQVETSLGDRRRLTRDLPTALAAYSRAVEIGERLLTSNTQDAPTGGIVLQARIGLGTAWLAMKEVSKAQQACRQALELSDRVAEGRDVRIFVRARLPRASEFCGEVEQKTSGSGCPWYQKSAALWKDLKATPGFNPLMEAEARQVEQKVNLCDARLETGR